jgi:hypothetical protein
MPDINTALVAAIGGAGLLAALAFRQLVETVIRLNDELQEAIRDRQANAAEREILNAKITLLERQLAEQQEEIRLLKQQLASYREGLPQQQRMTALEPPIA